MFFCTYMTKSEGRQFALASPTPNSGGLSPCLTVLYAYGCLHESKAMYISNSSLTFYHMTEQCFWFIEANAPSYDRRYFDILNTLRRALKISSFLRN